MEKILNEIMMKRIYDINGYLVMVDEDLSEIFHTDVNKIVEDNKYEFLVGYYWTITDEELHMLRTFDKEKEIAIDQIKSNKTHKVYTGLGIAKISSLIGDKASNETCIKILNSMGQINEDNYYYKMRVNDMIKELEEKIMKQEFMIKTFLNKNIYLENN